MLANCPPALEGMRIAHVSDLHMGRWNEILAVAQQALLTTEFDLLCVTGDFGTRKKIWPRSAELAKRFFTPLAERHVVYAVLGNHDHPGIAEHTAPPITFLRNRVVEVSFNGGKLLLLGIEPTKPFDGHLAEVMPMNGAPRPAILLSHYPSSANRIRENTIDLVLSGHTHGGQVRFPVLGCVWAHDDIPRHMARGLHRLRNTMLHVSAGLGRSYPIPIRINCPPEISILTLRRSPLPNPASKS